MAQYNNYTDYKNSVSSEKLTLGYIYPAEKVIGWENTGGTTWRKKLDFVLDRVKKGSVELTRVDGIGQLYEGAYSYDIDTGLLYLYSEASDPCLESPLVFYKLFFSNSPLVASYQIEQESTIVEYLPRILRSPGFKSTFNPEKVSLTGSGTLTLENNDGYFDEIYNRLIWESKLVEIYSYHRDLPIDQAKIVYRGFINDGTYDLDKISFNVKDPVLKLDSRVPLESFTEDDNVSKRDLGTLKRQCYGRIQGYRVTSISQAEEEGFVGQGTLTVSGGSATGSGTFFHKDISAGDIIVVDGFEYTVERVNSNISLNVSSDPGFRIVASGLEFRVKPKIPNRHLNRKFYAYSHHGSERSEEILNLLNARTVLVSSTVGYEPGDSVVIGSLANEISSISGDSLILKLATLSSAVVGQNIIRSPIIRLAIDDDLIDFNQITNINNTSDFLTFTISDLAEFETAENELQRGTVNFTIGSTTATTSVDLSSQLKPRDWIKPVGSADADHIEIARVTENEIFLRTAPTSSYLGPAYAKKPNYISDNTKVAIDCYGKPLDNIKNNQVVETGAEIALDLLKQIDVLSGIINEQTFLDEAQINYSKMSLAIPELATTKTIPEVKDPINLINKTISSALRLDNDLNLAYKSVDAAVNPDARVIEDHDVISWSIQGRSGNLASSITSFYDSIEHDYLVNESSQNEYTYVNEFTSDFEISEKNENFTLYVSDTTTAEEITQRLAYNRSQRENIVKINASLTLADIESGEHVILNFRRMYKNNQNATKFSGVVTSIKRDGEKVEIEVSDLGNLFNRTSNIAADDTIDFFTDTEDQIQVTGYITDECGLIDQQSNEENNNLIG